MKKILFSLLCGILMFSFVTPVVAQELMSKRKVATFSPALVGSGSAQTQNKPVKKVLPKNARTTILRFEPGQLELSEVQKELLLNVAQQVNSLYRVPMVEAIGASRDVNEARERVAQIERFLNAYVSKRFEFVSRFIAPENVVRSVDNTVKIIVK